MSLTPSRLTVARKRRGLTMAALAQRVGLTARSISAYENGSMDPQEQTVEAIARALGFPVDFFSRPDIDDPLPAGASFRALTTMKAAQRDAALAAGAIAMELSAWMDQRFTLPAADLPDQRGHEPDGAATALRAQWRLGESPVRNVVHQLEAHGVRVFSLAEECREIDAFSFWRGGVPYVFLNTVKSAERSRFDAAHELGHLVLHRHGGPQGRRAEWEADRFAASFLMPKRSVIARAPRVPSLQRLVELKKVWNVSVAALAHRLHGLNLLSEWHYRQLCIEIGERGYRTREPKRGPRETSQVVAKVFSALREEGLAKRDIARDLAIPVSEIDALIFGLALVVLGGGDGAPTPRLGPGP
jgi:Zn-dependent peptidase ImmA (M78 family)/transcriptional regulator with XRE-family HTH domain